MRRERGWKKGYKNLKYVLKKRVVSVSLASIAFLLTACQQQRSIVREKIVQVPTIKTEQVWKYKTDTLYRYETDSILIETIIHDTLIQQRVETKPLFVTVRDTVLDTKTETAKAENKRLKEENKRLINSNKTADKINTGMAIAYALGVIGMVGLMWAAKRETK